MLTPWLKKYLEREVRVRARATPERGTCAVHFECLTFCGLKDCAPEAGQFCIDTQLAAALRGEVTRGLFVRGAATVPFGTAIRPVRELIDYLLTGRMPADLTAG